MNKKFEDSPRLVSVYNTESEAVPPYAALEVFGWDKTKLAFKVRKPTKISHNDIMFNLGFIIPALSLGSAANTFPLSAAISQRGEDLGAGDVCGTYPGEWYLRSGATGFSILETIAGGRGVAVVVPTTGSLVEYVQPLGFGAESERPDGLPGNYINGQLFQLNPESGLFESQGESIWIAPSAPYKRATLAGNSYNRKVYVADIPDAFRSGSGSGAGGPEHGGPGTIIATIPSFSRCVAGVLQLWAMDVIEYPDGEVRYGDEYYYGTAGCCECPGCSCGNCTITDATGWDGTTTVSLALGNNDYSGTMEAGPLISGGYYYEYHKGFTFCPENPSKTYKITFVPLSGFPYTDVTNFNGGTFSIVINKSNVTDGTPCPTPTEVLVTKGYYLPYLSPITDGPTLGDLATVSDRMWQCFTCEDCPTIVVYFHLQTPQIANNSQTVAISYRILVEEVGSCTPNPIEGAYEDLP